MQIFKALSKVKPDLDNFTVILKVLLCILFGKCQRPTDKMVKYKKTQTFIQKNTAFIGHWKRSSTQLLFYSAYVFFCLFVFAEFGPTDPQTQEIFSVEHFVFVNQAIRISATQTSIISGCSNQIPCLKHLFLYI